MDTTTRPRRFPLRLPVRYRGRGETGWRRSLTASISASGAVIEGTAPDVPLPLIVAIDLPDGGRLIGRARVIDRRCTPSSAAPQFVVAVARFRIARRD